MKAFLIRLGLLVFAGILLVSIAELGLRTVGLHGSTELDVFAHDPLLGWKFEPNQTGWHRLLDFSVEYRINSKGLRDHEHQYNRPSEVYRILVLGDSVVEGYGVAQEKVFSRKLETLFEGSGRAVEVINAGVRGYSTDQQLLYFEYEGIKYKPDLTLIVFGTNELNTSASLGMGARTYYKPFFTLADSGLVLQGVPVPRWQPQQRWIDPIVAGLRPFATYQLAHYYIDRWRGARSQVDQTKAVAGWTAAWRVEKALLGRFQKTATDAGSRFAIVLNDLHDTTRSDRFRWRTLTEFCVAEQIPLLQLGSTSAFRDGSQSYQLPYDRHWNEYGHELVAQAMREFLQSGNLLTTPLRLSALSEM